MWDRMFDASFNHPAVCPACASPLRVEETQSGGGYFPRHQSRFVTCDSCRTRAKGERREISETVYASPDEKGLRGGGKRWSPWTVRDAGYVPPREPRGGMNDV